MTEGDELEKFDRPFHELLDEMAKQIDPRESRRISRRGLDKIVMGEILGLTEDEQLEVYRAVVDLVRSRIERARSVKRGL